MWPWFFKKKPAPVLDPRKDAASIGNLAIELGYITPEVLEEALKIQKERVKLGQILVDMEAITSEERDELLMEQKIRWGKVCKEDQIAFERKKKRRRIRALGSVFKEAAEDARQFVASVNGEAKAVGE
jgi:hypothetical protein